MRSKIVLFIFGLVVWCGLVWPPDPQHIIVGFIVALIVAAMTGDLFVSRPHILKHPSRYFWFIVYIPVFLWGCLKANLDVAYRVFHPFVPINPGIVKVKTKLKTDIGLTFLANSITLTPGTFTIDIDKEKGFLYIHWIDVKTKDIDRATEIIVRPFERILERIFE